MHADVVDLREFYLSATGRAVRKILRDRLATLWPNLRGETILAIGYGTPLLRPLLSEAASLMALMPAPQGVAYWPREGPNLACLADERDLPLADNSVDRVILLHALEGSAEPRALLREVWRVLKSGGRLLAIVPNRRGWWAHSDRTPFGTGQPYSAFQLKDTLRDQGFLTNRTSHALFMPPSKSRLAFALADRLEKYGEMLFPALGGLLMIEAGKQLYAPLQIRTKPLPHRLVLPLPASNPLPAG